MKALKILAAYLIASLCFTLILGGMGEGHAHVAYSNSIGAEVLISPLMPPLALIRMALHIAEHPNGPYHLLTSLGVIAAFVIPLLIALAIFFRKRKDA